MTVSLTMRRWLIATLTLGGVAGGLFVVGDLTDRDQLETVLAHQHRDPTPGSARRPTTSRAGERGERRATPGIPTATGSIGATPTPSTTLIPAPAAGAPATGATTSRVSTTGTTPTATSPSREATVPAAPPSGGACAGAPSSPAVVNVTTTGARAGDSGDDTAAIQAAIDAVPNGGTVLVPDGIYLINGARGVRPKSSMTLRLAAGAVLRVIATSSGNYNVIRIQGVSNVAVVGGTVEGDLGRHPGDSGQWGHGISVNDSRSVTIDSVTSAEAWGDGFYVGGTSSADITLCRVRADHNRRQGISVTDVDGMVIRDSVFTRTVSEPGGAGSGIDLEPNGNQHVHNVQLLNNTITDNSVQGLSIGISDQYRASSSVRNITVRGNTFDNNGLSASPTVMRTGMYISDVSTVLVEGNTVRRSHGAGIYVTSGSRQVTVRGNTVTGTTKAGKHGESGAGIAMYQDVGTVVTGNTVTGNAGTPIFTYDSQSTISGNTTS